MAERGSVHLSWKLTEAKGYKSRRRGRPLSENTQHYQITKPDIYYQLPGCVERCRIRGAVLPVLFIFSLVETRVGKRSSACGWEKQSMLCRLVANLPWSSFIFQGIMTIQVLPIHFMLRTIYSNLTATSPSKTLEREATVQSCGATFCFATPTIVDSAAVALFCLMVPLVPPRHAASNSILLHPCMSYCDAVL